MDILAASLVGAIVLAVILLLALRKPVAGPAGTVKRRRGTGAVRAGKAPTGRDGGAASGTARGLQPHCCPLCATPLVPGERVKSDIAAGKGDRIMRIFGCPNCWPAVGGRPPRLCPVCGGEIPADGYAVARYFERPGRKHVHVLGCSRCRPGA